MGGYMSFLERLHGETGTSLVCKVKWALGECGPGVHPGNEQARDQKG